MTFSDKSKIYVEIDNAKYMFLYSVYKRLCLSFLYHDFYACLLYNIVQGKAEVFIFYVNKLNLL